MAKFFSKLESRDIAMLVFILTGLALFPPFAEPLKSYLTASLANNPLMSVRSVLGLASFYFAWALRNNWI